MGYVLLSIEGRGMSTAIPVIAVLMLYAAGFGYVAVMLGRLAWRTFVNIHRRARAAGLDRP